MKGTLTGGGGDDEFAADCRYWGLDPALFAPPQDEGLWPENVAAVTAFLVVSNQWRCTGGPGGVVWHGMDYTAAEAGLRLANVTVTPGLWSDVQMIEAGAVEALNRK